MAAVDWPSSSFLLRCMHRDTGTMRIDLAGQVASIKLPRTRALLPLFEAVVNSVHAIAESGEESGSVDVIIRRVAELGPLGEESDSQFIPEIESFEIVDNGVGFDERNFESFNTSYSTFKASIGGKGVGRLLWLKAFESARVESVYSEAGMWYERRFDFLLTKNGVESPKRKKLDEPPPSRWTKVTLADFRPEFREEAPKGAETIALRIVEHCLVMYLLGRMPRVTVRDPSRGVVQECSDLFERQIADRLTPRVVEVGPYRLQIQDVLLRPSSDAVNAIHYCANGRAVREVKLGTQVAHADGLLRRDGVELRYAACVTGDLLDRAANAERTDFTLDAKDELALNASKVTWEDLERVVMDAARNFLEPLLSEARENAFKRIERFVNDEEPRYRVLLSNRRAEVERLPAAMSDERLEAELHRIETAWRHEARAGVKKAMQEFDSDTSRFPDFAKRFRERLGELSEVSKADLAEYVIHRRTVLEFFAKLLDADDSGGFSKEEALHGLIFPLRSTSGDVDYESHNLWLLDERLVFHQYLASDLEFNEQRGAPISIKSKKRPDLLIYNRLLPFAEEVENPLASITIVEFKRPERKLQGKNNSPVDQVYEYVAKLRAGKVKHLGGGSMPPLPTQTRFFCTLVLTLTAELRESLMVSNNFRLGPDGQSLHLFNEHLNASVEVIDYRKVLIDAKRRNQAFFHKLSLPSKR